MAKQQPRDDAREMSPAVRDALAKAMAELEHRAARSLDPCPVTQMIALSDPRVQRTLAAKLEDGLLFHESRCLHAGEVLFDFTCPPDRICLIRPAFLVRVDFATSSVVEILDPFIVPDELTTSHSQKTFGFGAPPSFGVTGASDVTEEVRASISGSYRTARISVDGVTIPQFNGEGSASVRLIPPTVDVVLVLEAPAPAEFKFEVTIRGRKKGDDGVFGGGKQTRTFTYKFSDFGLPTGSDA